MALRSNALAKTADVVADVGCDSTTAERYINAASQMVEAFLNRGPLQRAADFSEALGGFGTVAIYLSRCPVESVASVTVDGETVDASEWSLDDTGSGKLYRQLGWPWTAPLYSGAVETSGAAGQEQNRITVVYTGGWVLPNDTPPTGSPTPPYVLLPSDIELACGMLAGHLFRRRGKDLSALAESVGNASKSWGRAEAAATLPSEVRAMLSDYARAN